MDQFQCLLRTVIIQKKNSKKAENLLFFDTKKATRSLNRTYFLQRRHSGE